MNLKEQIQWCKAQVKSGYEVIAIRSILTRLQGLEKPVLPPHAYHNQSVELYFHFLKKYGLPPLMEVRQAMALKELLYKLQLNTTTKSPQGAYHALGFIFENWERLNVYHQKKKQLTHINNNLVEILDQIRNGATKQASNLNEAQRFHNELTQK